MSDNETNGPGRIDLDELGRVGEEYAQALPVEQVRRLGQQRRTRRHLATIGVAVATVVVATGAAFGSGVLTTDRTPEPAVSPTVVTASPVPTQVRAPARTVTTDNLITAAAVPVVGREKYTATIHAADREGDRLSVCTPREGGLSGLGPTQEVDQNFVLVRRADGSKNPAQEPFNGEPTIFTRAMQFESKAAADTAYATIRGWLKRCPSIMEYEPIGKGIGWIPVSTGVGGAKSGFTEFSWRLVDDTSGEGYFESLGVVQVGDRIALTVSVVYGQDYNVSLQPAGDPDTESPAHPQFGLVTAAAERLQN